jgi:polar amino acid transport system substrate-binding protein
MRHRTVSSAAFAAVVALTLTACASGSTGTNASPTAGSPAVTRPGFDTSSITKDDAIAALVPSAVSQDGKLTIGTDLSYAPAEFVDADGTTPIGFDTDLARALANLMGLEADIVSSSFDAIIPGMGTRYELGISSFTVTAKRLEAVNMVTYIMAGNQWAVATGNPSGFDGVNVCGFTIGVQTNTTQQDALTEMAAACPADKPVEILPYADQGDVTTNLIGGKVQAMWADSPVTQYAVGQSGGKLELLGDITDSAPEAVVVAKADMEMTNAVQAALQKLMDDGTLKAILGAWGNESSALATAEINPDTGF